MSIIDLCIIIFLLLGALIGFKQGFTKSLVNCVGYILIVVIAFVLKNPISEFMMNYLPFFDFYGLIKGVSVLNIAVYEIIAFALVFGILLIILKILLLATTIFEKILTLTIILGIPSKILGAVVGLIKNYIVVFVVLYVLALPNFAGSDFVKSSGWQKPILENTPILSSFASKSLTVFDEFVDLSEKYKNTDSSNEFNLEALDLFLKYDIVKATTVQKLIDKGKLHIDGADKLLEKYEEE